MIKKVSSKVLVLLAVFCLIFAMSFIGCDGTTSPVIAGRDAGGNGVHGNGVHAGGGGGIGGFHATGLFVYLR